MPEQEGYLGIITFLTEALNLMGEGEAKDLVRKAMAKTRKQASQSITTLEMGMDLGKTLGENQEQKEGTCDKCGGVTHDRQCIRCIKLERRGFQLMARTIFNEMVPREYQTVAISEGQYNRAGGDVECMKCGLPFIEHPQIPGFPTFHMTCDHSIVKL